MDLPFQKVEGLGNHFVLIDERVVGTRDWPTIATTICPARTGVGADGLLVVTEPTRAGACAQMRMFNPDGTEDMCGNGARCVAHHVSLGRRATGEATDDTDAFILDTISGAHSTVVSECTPRSAVVRMDLGPPGFAPTEMPAVLDGSRVMGRQLAFGDQEATIHLVSMGTPICVIFGSHPGDEEFMRRSVAIETADIFPERVSVMWAEERGGNHLALRIWERATGETQACGTGACASAVSAILTDRAASPVAVEMAGGTLRVEWGGGESDVTQIGPAGRVYVGKWPARQPD